MKFADDNTARIYLGDNPVIASGRRQNVYDHPSDMHSIIKIPKPETCDQFGSLLEESYTKSHLRRATAYHGFLREFREFVEVAARTQNSDIVLPIVKVLGVVETDLGLGCVYEKIAEPSGQLSPTLLHLKRSGMITSEHIEAMERHFQQVISLNVIMSDKNPLNMVFQTLRGGSSRFVRIDSFGLKTLVPLRRWSPTLNERKVKKMREYFLKFMTEG